jgi:hypothetical protein
MELESISVIDGDLFNVMMASVCWVKSLGATYFLLAKGIFSS